MSTPDLPVSRPLIEACLKWTRWFSWACLAGGILLCLTLVLIPFGGFALWQYMVLKNAADSLESVLQRHDPRDLAMALESIGFQFLIQIIGIVAGLVLTTLIIVFAVMTLGISFSELLEPGALESHLQSRQIQPEGWTST